MNFAMKTSTEPYASAVPPADYNDEIATFYTEFYAHGKRIRTIELDEFGYRYTARHIAVTPVFNLYELLPLDSSRQANACFLSADPKLGGVIVPYPFQEHKARVKTWFSWRFY